MIATKALVQMEVTLGLDEVGMQVYKHPGRGYSVRFVAKEAGAPLPACDGPEFKSPPLTLGIVGTEEGAQGARKLAAMLRRIARRIDADLAKEREVANEMPEM